jgi:hypothetical protein
LSPQWADLDNGYVGVPLDAVAATGLLYAPGTSKAGLAAASTHQGLRSRTELSTRPQGSAATEQGARICLPVYAVDGQYDRHYCSAALIVTDDSVLEPIFNDRYRAFALERYRQGFAARSTDSAPYLPGSREKAEKAASTGGFEPVLEVYQDTALCNAIALSEDEAIVLGAYMELVRTTVVHAVLDKTFDLRVLRPVDAAVAQTFGADFTSEACLTTETLSSALIGDDSTTLFIM